MLTVLCLKSSLIPFISALVGGLKSNFVFISWFGLLDYSLSVSGLFFVSFVSLCYRSLKCLVYHVVVTVLKKVKDTGRDLPPSFYRVSVSVATT